MRSTCFRNKWWAGGKYSIENVDAVSLNHKKMALIFVDNIGQIAIDSVANFFGTDTDFINENYQHTEGYDFKSAYNTSRHFINRLKSIDYEILGETPIADHIYFLNTSKGHRVIMPNGTDGLICPMCGNFFAYVEPNQKDGAYMCRSCRGDIF